MYYLPEPPYFLLIVGLFTGLTCGLAFEATLKMNVRELLKKPANQMLKGSGLQLPFLGICVGICVFLSAGLEVFLFDPWLSYSIALPMTIFIAALVWVQLESVLKQIKEGGSKAIDLDAFY
ncbi:hypothetical protein [Crocosphaera sp. XPORK-15E]|uniref:hypothetical protein n=1 Tax=Crocosphaera sp. XPORK-15E TaxID=3110247 RepID=UPI002B2174FA|nr:hypothetical protein [Crocosphaera sp. XPORK-15E]MEA5535123.1 hypothetical protein [Crocosphaera sp. XPORK-15E]